MANGNATIIVGLARMGRSIAPFFQCVKSYFIQFITNQLPETGRIMPWLRLFTLPEGWWFDIEVLTTTRKHIFSPACPLSEKVNSG